MGAGYIYQWYKLRYHGQYNTQQAPIYGATSSTYIATSVGEYYVSVWDGTCQFTSDRFLVTDKPQAKLTNAALTNTAVDIAAGVSTDLKVSFAGVGPWNFYYYDGSNTSLLSNISANPYTLTVTPALSKQYSLISVENSCGVGTVSGTMQVNVGNPSFIPTAPANTSAPQNPKDPNATQTSSITVCAGSTVLLPYTIAGTWSAKRNMTVELYNAAGNYVSGSNQSGLTTNPIQYFVPSSIATGTYSIKMYSKEPYIETGVFSTYTIDVGGSSCTVPLATINAQTNCTNASLNATPTGSGYSFQWYKNGVLIPDATFSYYSAKTNGNYTVNVAKAATSYNATSTAYPVVLAEFNSLITASSGQICEGTGSVTFTSANTGVGFTHQWYYSSTDFGFAAISGATNATYTATQTGFYFVIIKNGDCEVKSNILNTCNASVNFVSKTVCTNSAVIVPFIFSGGENQSITIQLINATSNAVVVADLQTILSTNAINYNPTVNIPNSVPTGDYKFKIISGNPSNVSRVSNGILSISSQTAGVAPTITRSLSSITSPQNVNISATGCSGTVNWTTPDVYYSPLYPEFTWYVSQTNTFSATCTDLTSGCTSPSGSATVTFSCSDAYEPNNTYQTSTAIASNVFMSPVICLDGLTNTDWFTWTNGGHIYYIKASLASVSSTAGNYKIKLTYDNTNLIVETIPETVGQTLDTYLTLFDTDGVTVLSMNDNGNANGFSKIIYGLININPCVSALTLYNITDDYSSGTIIKEANANTGTITATNKITGTANVIYRAGKSITLNAGFKADNGTVFKTEFGGCN